MEEHEAMARPSGYRRRCAWWQTMHGAPLWTFRVGVTARITPESPAHDDQRPFLGRHYGGWLPRARWNKGSPFRCEVLDISWYWLIFHGSITRWGVMRWRDWWRHMRQSFPPKQ